MTDHVAASERLGKYRIIEEIHYGGIGLVFKAEDTLLKRIVALKVIAEQGDITDDLRSRFFKDAQACAKLSHPNMVTVYDASEEQGRLFMVVEYVEGDELEQTITTREDHPLEDRLGIMIQVCRGLAYAHQRGVLHRDVRPENVIVQRSGMVKLLDFGMARIAARGDATPAGRGQLGDMLRYAAPEQLRGQGDIRSDVFSAAALFYDLVASRSPRRGTDAMAVLEGIDSTAPSLYTPDAGIPRDLETVLERALRREPAERFRDMSQLQTELEGVRRRLREEARAVHRHLEAGAPELARLLAQLAERIDGPAPAAVTVPDEQLPLAALESLRREQVEEIERARGLLERAESLRPAYAEAKSLARKADWAAAAAALERIVQAMPEHAGGVHALEEARREARRAAPAPGSDDAETVMIDRAQLQLLRPREAEPARPADASDDAETVMIDRAKLGRVHLPAPDVAPRPATPSSDAAETVILDRSRPGATRPPTTERVTPTTGASTDLVAPSAARPTELLPPATGTPTDLVPGAAKPTDRAASPASTPTDLGPPSTPTPAGASPPATATSPDTGRSTADHEATAIEDRPTPLPARVPTPPPTPSMPPVSIATPSRVGPADPMPSARVFTRPTPPAAADGTTRSRAGRFFGAAGRRAAAFVSGWLRVTLAVGAVLLLVAVLGLYWMHGASETARRAEQELAGARQQTEAARDGARRAGAEQLTPDLYAGAAAKEREAGELARGARAREAIAALGDATRRYGEAERSAWAAGKARDAADEARRRMLAEKARGASGTTEMERGLARERQGEERYRDRRFAEAAEEFDAAGGLFAKAVAPVAAKPPEPPAPAPGAGTPGGAPPPARAADADIRELIRSYSRAFETKDLGLLREIRPGLRSEDITRHQAVFAQTRSYRLSLKVDAINVRGDEAEARGQREDVIVTPSGETVQTSGSFTFRFKRVNDRWRIDSVR